MPQTTISQMSITETSPSPQHKLHWTLLVIDPYNEFISAWPQLNEYPVGPISWMCPITEMVSLLADGPVNDVELPS